MKLIIFLSTILIFLVKTETVLSAESIFNVNNIKIEAKTYNNKEIFLNTAFKKGFKKLIERILLKKDQIKFTNISNEQIKKLVSHYKI